MTCTPQDLAASVLSGTPFNAPSDSLDLSAHIQAAIDGWLEDRREPAPSDVSGAVK